MTFTTWNIHLYNTLLACIFLIHLGLLADPIYITILAYVQSTYYAVLVIFNL